MKRRRISRKRRVIPYAGRGLYLKPYGGKGLYLKPYKGKNILNVYKKKKRNAKKGRKRNSKYNH